MRRVLERSQQPDGRTDDDVSPAEPESGHHRSRVGTSGWSALTARQRAGVGALLAGLVVSVAVGVRLGRDSFGGPAEWVDSDDIPLSADALSFPTHELSTSAEGDGKVVTGSGGSRYAEGRSVTLTAVPDEGVQFTGWSGDIEGYLNPIVIEMDADKHVVATFATDTTPPAVSDVRVEPFESAAVIRWTTDEPATSQVAIGPSAAYEAGVVGTTNLARDHAVLVPGLPPDSPYHYSIRSANAAGSSAGTPDATVQTPPTSGPAVFVWGGDRQVVGVHGDAQTWVNIVGNLSDPDGVASASYRLNGGASRRLTLGPDNRRLQAPGDFNVDLAYGDLNDGDNEVVITASDGRGRASSTTVVVERRRSDATLPYSTDWAAAGRIADQAQMIDGRWATDGDTIRPLELGYDRIVAVGDVSWHDYEMTVPVTVRGIGPNSGAYLSGASLVGLALNWNGHTRLDDEQPAAFFYPTGALAWYRFNNPVGRFELRGNMDDPLTRHQEFQLAFDRPYMFKARSETVAGGVRYSWKVWPQGTAEPTLWDLTVTETDGPPTGSVAVIAHQADVQFGDISVTPLPG